MQSVKQTYSYSTIVSEHTKENEFLVEFIPLSSDEQTDGCPIIITKDFDELLDLLEGLDDFQ